MFLLSHLKTLGSDILRTHPPGVRFWFSYSHGLNQVMNNYPLEWQERYLAELNRLFGLFNTDAIRFSLFDVTTLYSSIDEELEEMWANFETHLPLWQSGLCDNAKRLASARANLVPVGISDLRPNWEAEVERSARICEAVDSLDKRRWFNKYSDRIQLVFQSGPEPAVHIGSCRASIMHPWMGLGILESNSEAYIPKIVHEIPSVAQLRDVHLDGPWAQLGSQYGTIYVSQSTTRS